MRSAGAYPVCEECGEAAPKLGRAGFLAHCGQEFSGYARAKGNLVSVDVFIRIANMYFKLDMVS
jgi:hypothetical protein